MTVEDDPVGPWHTRSIQRADGDDKSIADITYAYTSISDHGDRALEEFTDVHFKSFMVTWEKELNHFLSEGTMLEIMYEIPSRNDVSKIIITPEVIRKEVNPLTLSEGEEKSA